MLPLIEPRWPAPANVRAFSTTREGGVSVAPYASLNLGLHVGDEAGAVRQNRRRLTECLPGSTELSWLEQVHGTDVVSASAGGRVARADAQWSDHPGIACAVLTADCLPVLLCTVAGDRVAAVHAGWRGLAGGVVEAAVDAMRVDPGTLLAWLGPAIGPAAFEVGAEVRDAFLCAAGAAAEATAAAFRPGRDGRFQADLYALARLRLAAVGVTAVYGGNLCTYLHEKMFYSYRRDGTTGRMASVITLVPDDPAQHTPT